MEKLRWKITVNSEVGQEIFKRFGPDESSVRSAFQTEYREMFGVDCEIMDVHLETSYKG